MQKWHDLGVMRNAEAVQVDIAAKREKNKLISKRLSGVVEKEAN